MAYDAIIVGARVAGASTALLLARKGYRVLLLDRAAFPSDTLSTHYIHPAGIAFLSRWGLLDRLRATGCPPVHEAHFDFGPFRFGGAPPPIDGIRTGYAPRRTVLDKLLIDAAVEAGAELRETTTVAGLLHDGDRVTGVRIQGRGALIEERAAVTVGADGKHSLIARLVEARTYEVVPALSSGYYSYWSDLPLERTELWIRPGFTLIAFPTHGQLTVLVMSSAIAEYPRVRLDVERAFLEMASTIPELRERLAGARCQERWKGTADLPNFFRVPYGNGWALVGDAGYHKDPLTAQGITDAFRDAGLLADALHVGFDRPERLTEALRCYEVTRNQAVLALYKFTCERATHSAPPPPMAALLTALASNPEEASRFVGIDAGTVRCEEFFHPDHVARVLRGHAPQ
jgi:2-polyprenyl-6-methoxyphenol hydroxylase-like FAD-dependent oxidoreductase